MNPWQMAQQLKHVLEQVVWPGVGGHTVFGPSGQRVCVFAGAPSEDQLPGSFPCCFIQIGNGVPDESHPELIAQTFTMMTVARGAGDPLGEHAIIGGASPSMLQSAGRGVAEVDARVRSAVNNLTGADGAKIIVTGTSLGAPSPLGDGAHLALSGLDVTALCTSAPAYAAPQELAVSGSAYSWAGPHCSDRWDFINYQLVEKAGTNPSSDPTDGTLLYTGTAAAYSGTVSQAGNTYTVFANYRSRPGSSAVVGTSSPDVGSYRAVSA